MEEKEKKAKADALAWRKRRALRYKFNKELNTALGGLTKAECMGLDEETLWALSEYVYVTIINGNTPVYINAECGYFDISYEGKIVLWQMYTGEWNKRGFDSSPIALTDQAQRQQALENIQKGDVKGFADFSLAKKWAEEEVKKNSPKPAPQQPTTAKSLPGETSWSVLQYFQTFGKVLDKKRERYLHKQRPKEV